MLKKEIKSIINKGMSNKALNININADEYV